jgi:acyl-CoA dehydrogenase
MTGSQETGSQEEAFRHQALAFLEANAAVRRVDSTAWGVGPDSIGLFDDPVTERELLEAARTWRRRLFDAGLGWINGPPDYGGRGLPPSYTRIYAELEARFETPDQMRLSIGLGMVGPTIAAHGSAEAKARYLAAIYRSDIVACQLFSEPEAGSDLAAIRTRAVPADEGWRVTGHKLWTSGAHFADIGMVLTRTGDERDRGRSLTMFLIDMHSPGVTVRPLRQMTGHVSFDEVYLDDVVTPDAYRLGDVGGGWTVMMTTLLNERSSIGGGGRGVGGGDYLLRRLVALARHAGRTANPVVRQRIAALHTGLAIAGYFQLRVAAITSGDGSDPLAAIGKLLLTANLRRAGDLAGELLGPGLVADMGEWGSYAWSELVLATPGLRVGGGTDEIQKNMLAERVLGLPRGPR